MIANKVRNSANIFLVIIFGTKSASESIISNTNSIVKVRILSFFILSLAYFLSNIHYSAGAATNVTLNDAPVTSVAGSVLPLGTVTFKYTELPAATLPLNDVLQPESE